VLATSAIVLVGGGYYVEANVPWRSLKWSTAIAWLALACLVLSASYAIYQSTNLFHDDREASREQHRQMTPITGGSYTVQPGDTLSDIADRWGDKGGYQDLVKKNPGTQPSGTDVTKNPDLIHPGDVFKNP
jgi:hypothetical protein